MIIDKFGRLVRKFDNTGDAIKYRKESDMEESWYPVRAEIGSEVVMVLAHRSSYKGEVHVLCHGGNNVIISE